MRNNLLANHAVAPLPIIPGDWVSDGQSIARVRDVYPESGRTDRFLLDLILYDRAGNKVGRESPAMGGPRHYEPAVERQGWDRIPEPKFPIELKWLPAEGGGRTAGWDFGEALPDRAWLPPRREEAPALIGLPDPEPYRPDPVLAALMEIAEGHNDARGLAIATLTELGFIPRVP